MPWRVTGSVSWRCCVWRTVGTGRTCATRATAARLRVRRSTRRARTWRRPPSTRDMWRGRVAGLDPHVDLWRDVVRRARPDLAAPAAALLGFTAWRAGDGTLAWFAVQRALSEDPEYSLAHLMAEALLRALPPSALDDLPDEPDYPTRTRCWAE